MGRVYVCCLAYTIQKLHIIPEEEIPKKTERRWGGEYIQANNM
jgi:hypothetical protein